MSYVYAAIVALLIVACAVVIAIVNVRNTNQNLNVDNDTVLVSTKNYVVPLNGATVAKDYSGSELQYNDTLKQWEIHKAIDFVAGEDKNVYAMANGTVSNVYTNYLEGTVIEISHTDGLVSVYKSLDKDTKVKIGDKVTAGDIIGEVSSSMAQELNSGNHLHFELLKEGKKVNPNDYLDLGSK